MRPGVRLGIDVGKVRIGIARCDPSALLATPLETVARDRPAHSTGHQQGRDIARIMELSSELAPIELVVGLPLGLGGHRTPSTEDAETFAALLAAAADGRVDVRLVDERLSTVTAQGQLRQAGRSVKGSRSFIDQAAAVVILQHALDMERSRGIAPGTVVGNARDPEGPQ